MERLTKKKLGSSYPLKNDASAKVGLFTDYDGFFAFFEAVNRLGTIEDIIGDDYDLSRIRELVEADREGRCVALSEPMVPMVQISGDTDVYCPTCEQNISGGWPLSDAGDYRKLCQCPHCGQAIDDTKCEFSDGALKGEKHG